MFSLSEQFKIFFLYEFNFGSYSVFLSNFTIFNLIVYLFFTLFFLSFYQNIVKKRYYYEDVNNFCLNKLNMNYLHYKNFMNYLINLFMRSESNIESIRNGVTGYGANNPKPPKKTMIEKIKEHLSEYRYVYIGLGISIIGTILWFKNGGPPSNGSILLTSLDGSENGFDNNMNKYRFIKNSLKDLSSELANPSKVEHMFTLSTLPKSLVIDENNFIFKYKYYLIFGCGNLAVLTDKIYNSYANMDAKILPFILSNNVINLSLFNLNRNVASMSTIGYMAQHIELVKSFNIIRDYFLDLDSNYVDNLESNCIDSNLTYSQFIYGYLKILNDLTDLNISTSVLSRYSSFILNRVELTPQLQGLINENLFNVSEFQDLLNQIDKAFDNYLIDALRQDKDLTNEEILDGFKKIVREIIINYKGSGLGPEILSQFFDSILLMILENYIIHNDCLDIIGNEDNFDQFMGFYLKTLKTFNLNPLNVNNFYLFLFNLNLN